MTIFLDANQKPYLLPPNEEIFWRISGYSLIQSKDYKVLMVIPTWNTLYELPGGGVEETESIVEGIKRECYEETGYKITLSLNTPFYVGESNFYHRHAKKFFHSLIMVYPAKLTSKKQNTKVINTTADGDEIQKVEWVHLSKLNKKNCHPTIYPAIKLLQKSTGRYVA